MKDWILFGLLLKPYRCNQCLKRFFRFRSRRVQRAVTVTVCLIPVIVLAAWFIGLRNLQKTRAASNVEQSKPEPLTPKTIQQLLDNKR